MPGGSDQSSSSGAVSTSDLGKTLIQNLNQGVTNPTPLSADTVKTLQGITATAGQPGFTTGLNNAFTATANVAQNGIAGLANFSAPSGSFTSVGQYDDLYNKNNVATQSATSLTPQLAGLSGASYADQQAKDLYQQTQTPSFAQQGFQDIYGELQNPSFAEQGYQDIYNRLGQPSITEQNLNNYANGSLIGANPYLDAVLKTTRDNTLGSVNSAFGSTGRLGSGLNVSTLGSTIDSQENSARLAQYNADVQNQFGANAAIEAARAGATSQQETALQGNDASRNNRYALQQQALTGQDAATNSQLTRSLSALSAQDQFRLSQLAALRDTSGAIDTSNDNRTTTLSGVLSGKNTAEASAASAAQAAASLNLQAQQANAAAQLNAANSLGGQFSAALAPNLAALGATQALDAPNQSTFGNSLAVLQALGGGQAQGVAAEVPWWQQVLGAGAGLAGSALAGGALK